MAASSTESVELLLLAGGKKRHVVLPKVGVRKAVLELRGLEMWGGEDGGDRYSVDHRHRHR